MADRAEAAITVLDALGVKQPVDWLRNAWGGHVGILVAARHPERCRTLTTVGTPVHAYPRRELATVHLLLALHRVVGPARFLTGGVVDALLSPRTRATDPEAVAITADGFREADRAGMRNAVVCISLRRPDLTRELARTQAPTLFVTGADHPRLDPGPGPRGGEAPAPGRGGRARPHRLPRAARGPNGVRARRPRVLRPRMVPRRVLDGPRRQEDPEITG